MCAFMNSVVVLVAFYCLDQVIRACGLKWKVFSFRFGVVSELTQLKGVRKKGFEGRGSLGWEMIHPDRGARENCVSS